MTVRFGGRGGAGFAGFGHGGPEVGGGGRADEAFHDDAFGISDDCGRYRVDPIALVGVGFGLVVDDVDRNHVTSQLWRSCATRHSIDAPANFAIE